MSCLDVFMTCMVDMEVIRLHQYLQITHAKQHPVPQTGKSTANAVSMTTQPGITDSIFSPFCAEFQPIRN